MKEAERGWVEGQLDRRPCRYRFGTVEFDESSFELRVDGVVVDVQRIPLEVLRLLLQRSGELVSKEEFRDIVWARIPTVDNVLGNALSKLRIALGDANRSRIVTRARIGYRLAGEVERVPISREPNAVFERLHPVPGRGNFLLEAPVTRSRQMEVWWARHRRTGELRLYKFSHEAQRLAVLKREVALLQVLGQAVRCSDAFVRVMDWNFDLPPYFLECEYTGEDLASWAVPRRNLVGMTLPKRLELFAHIVEPVAAAHAAGVLHGDLRPANIFVSTRSSDPRIRLWGFTGGHTDSERTWGSCSRMSDAPRVAERGRADQRSAGLSPYLAPECVAGGAGTAGSDVYALGLILFQLICGDFRRRKAPGWEHDVPAHLHETVAAATHGDPALRMGNAIELARCLQSLQEVSDWL